MIAVAAVLLAALLLPLPSIAKEPRSAAVRAEFKRLNPCPSTGERRGSCPGWVIDHIDPLCNGGLDAVSNMQYQTIEDAKVKDRWERELCRKRQ